MQLLLVNWYWYDFEIAWREIATEFIRFLVSSIKKFVVDVLFTGRDWAVWFDSKDIH